MAASKAHVVPPVPGPNSTTDWAAASAASRATRRSRIGNWEPPRRSVGASPGSPGKTPGVRRVLAGLASVSWPCRSLLPCFVMRPFHGRSKKEEGATSDVIVPHPSNTSQFGAAHECRRVVVLGFAPHPATRSNGGRNNFLNNFLAPEGLPSRPSLRKGLVCSKAGSELCVANQIERRSRRSVHVRQNVRNVLVPAVTRIVAVVHASIFRELAAYLGHAHVNDTYWYIEAVPELLELATRRLEKRKEVAP